MQYLKNLQIIQNRIRKERSLVSLESDQKEMSQNLNQTLPEIHKGKQSFASRMGFPLISSVNAISRYSTKSGNDTKSGSHRNSINNAEYQMSPLNRNRFNKSTSSIVVKATNNYDAPYEMSQNQDNQTVR